MRFQTLGANTSDVEVLNVDAHGIWLWVKGAEYFVPYEHFPWFKEAKLGQVFDVRLLHGTHLYWPQLDVDLETSSLGDPEGYPLIYR